ncbi:Nuclear transcription factor Y subunit B-8 [Abeliophyllum distichum]|uniref:Nuclear transcription factor Y subunit B-8 n=2 Tax=Forsythieae TaxID=426104 RepID=A0ABD1UMZ8_9LAMI
MTSDHCTWTTSPTWSRPLQNEKTWDDPSFSTLRFSKLNSQSSLISVSPSAPNTNQPQAHRMADSPGGSGSHDSGGGGGGDRSPRSSVREQDRFLPIANIGRIMKKALPTNGKIAKDAKDTVQECVSEFISFVTSEASDKCQKEKRKTVNGDDLLWAMATLGFEDYIAPLKAYLARYRELEGDTKGSARGADGSGKKDMVGTQLGSDAQVTYGTQLGSDTQFVHQGSFTPGLSYTFPH